MMRTDTILLLALFASRTVATWSRPETNASCLVEVREARAKASIEIFERVADTLEIMEATIISLDETSIKACIMYRRGGENVWEAIKQEVVIFDSGHAHEGQLEHLTSTILYTVHDEQTSAAIRVDDRGDTFLLVNRGNSRSNVNIRLKDYIEFERVLSDEVFGQLRFSPDGRYVYFMVESPKAQFAYESSFFDFPMVSRPRLVVYDTRNGRFRTLMSIPEDVSVGDLVWHPDSNHLIGVAWPNKPFVQVGPRNSNRPNYLCVIDLLNDKFALLTTGTHVDLPKVDPRGQKIVFFENDLESKGPNNNIFRPGLVGQASRLMSLSWGDALLALNNDVVVDIYKRVLVSPVDFWGSVDPVYGLYPLIDRRQPENSFNSDGSLVYINTYSLSSVRLLSVNTESGEVILHPDPNTIVLDIRGNLLLVKRSSINESPVLKLARISDQNDSATTTMTSTTTISTTTDIVTGTTLDPCEYLFTEIDIRGNKSVVDPDKIGVITTTIVPETTVGPLDLDQIKFVRVDLALNPKAVVVDTFPYVWNEDNVLFNAHLSLPKYRTNLTLIILFSAPGQILTSEYSLPTSLLLESGYAVLAVNPRGSKGMGNNVLEQIVDDQNDIDIVDGHNAVQAVFGFRKSFKRGLLHDPKLLSGLKAVMAQGFSANTALRLVAKHGYSEYQALLLENPVIDLTQLGSDTDILFGMQGEFFDPGEIADANLLKKGLEKSAITLVNGLMDVPTMSGAGMMARFCINGQAAHLQRLLNVENVHNELYWYPKNGQKLKGFQVLRHFWSRSLSFVEIATGKLDTYCPENGGGTVRPVTTTPYWTSTKYPTTTDADNGSTKEPTSKGLRNLASSHLIVLVSGMVLAISCGLRR